MLRQIVLRYQALINSVDKLIEVSGFDIEYLARQLKLKPANFLLKRKKADWTTAQLLALLSLIENSKFQDDIDELIIKQVGNNFISSEEFEKRMNWQ
jgi:hypothetical protein